jgi:hypothetical protein
MFICVCELFSIYLSVFDVGVKGGISQNLDMK